MEAKISRGDGVNGFEAEEKEEKQEEEAKGRPVSVSA